MEKDIVERPPNQYYGLRQTITLSVHLNDYVVDFGKRGTFGKSSSSTTSSVALQGPLPVSTEPGSSDEACLQLSLPSLPLDSTCEANTHSSASGIVDSATLDSLEAKGRKRNQARPWHLVRIEEEDQEDLIIPSVLLVARPLPTPLINELADSPVQAEEALNDKFNPDTAVNPAGRRLSAAPHALQQSSSGNVSERDEPLLIHGLSVSEYQHIYHSVVDPMLKTPAGDQRPYSLALGRKIKQKLWETLFYPDDGLSSPGLKRKATQIDVDISKEPKPQQPERNKTKH